MNPNSEDWITPYLLFNLDVPSVTSLTAGSCLDQKFKSGLIQKFSQKVDQTGDPSGALFEFANLHGPRFLLDLRDYCPRNIEIGRILDELPAIQEIKETNVVQFLIELFLSYTPEQIQRVRQTLHLLRNKQTQEETEELEEEKSSKDKKKKSVPWHWRLVRGFLHNIIY